jgi:hypothetical protein
LRYKQRAMDAQFDDNLGASPEKLDTEKQARWTELARNNRATIHIAAGNIAAAFLSHLSVDDFKSWPGVHKKDVRLLDDIVSKSANLALQLWSEIDKRIEDKDYWEKVIEGPPGREEKPRKA